MSAETIAIKYINVKDRKPVSYGREFRSYIAKPRVYICIDSENIIQNIEQRRQRPVAEFRKLMPEILKQAGLEDVKFRWSQTAGCSCGCSPGFILESSAHKDIFVHI
jgi:hypothetical protein